MSPRKDRKWNFGWSCIATLVLASVAPAQNEIPLTGQTQLMRFGCGDLNYRCAMTVALIAETELAVSFIPDEGWTGDIFLARHDFAEGWVYRANSKGYNAFTYTPVACGLADEPPSDDFAMLSPYNVVGVSQFCSSSGPELTIAHGLGAAYALAAYSTNVKVAQTLVLIDPIAPPGIIERDPMTFEQARHRNDGLRDRLWVQWGIGPRSGAVDENSDIGAEGYERLMERYEFDQPPYWASVYTGFDGGVEIEDTSLFAGLPVLIVGTPTRDRERRAEAKALQRWLGEVGAKVETFELSELGLEGVGGLPMAGDHADAIFDRLFEWSVQTREVTGR